MIECSLCSQAARMYCESDRASLCWDCDAKVHSANFLVARHSRCLLCRSCQSPTPWKASGPRLRPTVSACDRCVAGGGCDEKGESMAAPVPLEEDSMDAAQDGDDEEEEYYDDDMEEDEEEEEDDGDNQVVPWGTVAADPSAITPLPPPAASSSSSSSSDDSWYSNRRSGGRNADRPSSSQDDLSCGTSSQRMYPHRRASADDGKTYSGRRHQHLLRPMAELKSGAHSRGNRRGAVDVLSSSSRII